MYNLHDIPTMRQDAALEREALLEQHARDGEDPADFVIAMPSVDELVVATLLADALHDQGLSAEHGLASLAGKSRMHDAAVHRGNAHLLEERILLELAQDYPELSSAIWSMLTELDLPAIQPER